MVFAYLHILFPPSFDSSDASTLLIYLTEHVVK